MLDDKSMEQKLINIINSAIGEEIDINLETILIESGLIDSFELISIVNKIESVFEMTLDIYSVNMEDFETPRKMLSLIRKNLNEQNEKYDVSL